MRDQIYPYDKVVIPFFKALLCCAKVNLYDCLLKFTVNLLKGIFYIHRIYISNPKVFILYKQLYCVTLAKRFYSNFKIRIQKYFLELKSFQVFIKKEFGSKMFTVYQKKLKNAKLQRKEIRKVIEKNCVGIYYDEQTKEHLNYISNPKNFFHR